MSRSTDGQAAEGVISLRAHEEEMARPKKRTSARLWPCVSKFQEGVAARQGQSTEARAASPTTSLVEAPPRSTT